MSTIVELITAVVLSVFGISAEEPPTPITETAVIERCYTEPLPSSNISFVKNTIKKDNLVILNSIQKSIKIEQKRNENTIL